MYKPERVVSIDILRGLVMVIMALDHTRDFFHNTAMLADPMDPATTNVVLFFTRWITHFCAPIFVFLSGLSAYFAASSKTSAESSKRLIKRGLWLILAEVTIVTFGLTFNPFFNVIVLQVIWAIGFSMIILGLLKRISFHIVLTTGFLLVFGHNIIDYIKLPSTGLSSILATLFLNSRGSVIPINASHIILSLYAVLPWTGIMLLGYCIGPVFTSNFSHEQRRKFLLITGLLLTLLFVALRVLRGYGDPTIWSPGRNAFYSLLNTSKYPPSLQYTCMTLGPALMLLAFLERTRSSFANVLATYGKVPFFYYILHFYILHTLLAIAFFASGYTADQIADPNIPFAFRPTNFGYSLGIVYLIWILVVAILYKPSKWFSSYKTQHSQWWLKYV